MSPRLQRWCIWSTVPFTIIYLFGFYLAGCLPPVSPLLTSAELTGYYAGHRTAIQAGQLICLVSSGFIFIWPAAVSVQIARLEERNFPILAIVQYVMAAVLGVLFMLCSLVWTVAAYRPDLNPDTLRMLNDFGWLIFVMAYPEYTVQLGCVAIAGFTDKRSQPWLPRWACYATVLVALAGIGGGFATFAKLGPFAWNGLVGFWIPVVFFLVWMLGIILPYTLVATKRQELLETASP